MIDPGRLRELDGLIHYWQAKLASMRAYLSPAENGLIQSTIKVIEKLKELEIASG